MVRLQVWDTAGQERFRCMVPMYMRNADAALIVYDVTNHHSFDDVERWVKDLGRSNGTEEANIFLIGNKTDLVEKREVSEAEGKALAAKINAKFFELSSDQPNCKNPISVFKRSSLYLSVFSAILSELADDVVQSRIRVSEKKQEAQSIHKDKVAFGEDCNFDDSQSIKLKTRKFKCCSML